MADAGGAGNSPDGEEYESCFDLMKNNAIEVKKGGRGERACPNCWTAWERGSSTCGNCTIKKLPARTSRRGKQVEFEAKQQPSKADVDAAARAKRPRPPRERRNCSQCQKSCVKAQMKEDWDEPADERWCDVCWKNERRVLTTEPVRLNEVVYIKSGSDYSTSVEVPNATDGLRCKVVVDVTLEIVKDEPEDAKQERARAKVSRFMGNNYGSCHGKVVNVVDGERLGEYATRVSVKRDNENDLYVEKRKVEEALAKTQNGTRPPPKKDWGPFRRDGDCYYLGHARELFSEERYKLVLARELDQFPKQEDADSDDGDEDEDEDEENEDAVDEFTYVRSDSSKVDVDFDTFSWAAEEFFYRRPAVPAYGNRRFGHFGSTPKEVVTNCLYQCQVSLVSQLNIPKDELLMKLAEGKVKELEDAGINVSPEKLKSMVADVRKAFEGLPFDADENDRDWKRNRFKRASCVAMGVTLMKVRGVPRYVVTSSPEYNYECTDEGHKLALEKALELSPSLRKRYDEACAVQSLLSDLSDEGDDDDEEHTGSTSKEIFEAMMEKVDTTLHDSDIDISLVATDERLLLPLQIGFNIKTRATPAKTQKLWELAEAATVALGQVDQFELVEKVNELASGPDGLKREALAEAYKLDLVEDKDKLDILEKFFVVGTTYRRDMANVESLRVMPMPLAVYTEGYPKYWHESGKAHRVAFLVAQQCNKHRYALGNILEEAEAKGLLEDTESESESGGD